MFHHFHHAENNVRGLATRLPSILLEMVKLAKRRMQGIESAGIFHGLDEIKNDATKFTKKGCAFIGW